MAFSSTQTIGGDSGPNGGRSEREAVGDSYSFEPLRFTHGGKPATIIVESRRLVGQGATATVLRGIMRSTTSVELVALKVLGAIMTDAQRQTLRRETEVWQKIAHPRILPFYGTCNISANQLALVSPYMDKGNLCTYLEDNDDCNRLQLIYQVAEGLDYLHTAGFVHGDIKCENVLVDLKGNVVIADFGLTTQVDSGDAPTATFIRERKTVKFSAPELFTDEAMDHGIVRSKTRMSDVYAFGGLVYQIYEGLPPWHNLTDHGVMVRVPKGERPERPRHPLLTDALWDICRRCWTQIPGERPLISFLLLEICALLDASVQPQAPPATLNPTALSTPPIGGGSGSSPPHPKEIVTVPPRELPLADLKPTSAEVKTPTRLDVRPEIKLGVDDTRITGDDRLGEDSPMPRPRSPSNVRHPVFWFEDGDLIATAQGSVEKTLFKVHRLVLDRLSKVIAHMPAPEYPNPLEIPYVSSRSLGRVLEFVYPHQAVAEQLDMDDYVKLLRASFHLHFSEPKIFESALAELDSRQSLTPISPEKRLVLGFECCLPDWVFRSFVELVYAPGPNMNSEHELTQIPLNVQDKILAARFWVLRRRTALATRAEGPFTVAGHSTAASVCRRHIVELRSEVSVGASPASSRARLAGIVEHGNMCQNCTPNVFGIVVRNVFDEKIESKNLTRIWTLH